MYPSVPPKLTVVKGTRGVDSLDPGAAINYLWYRNGQQMAYPNASYILRYERVLPLDSAGVYWCEIFDTTGCVQRTDTFTYVPAGVDDEPHDYDIRIIPNPARDEITVVCAGVQTATIELIDVLGNVVHRSQSRHIDVRDLPQRRVLRSCSLTRESTTANVLW